MAYVNPGWINGAAPAISADNLNNISNTLESVPVANGGTGRATLTSGALITGNGTSAVGQLTGTGAVYAESTGDPQFGTLPVSCGGTGVTTLAQLKEDMGLANGGFVIAAEAPVDTTKMWIDSGHGNIMKVYDSDNSAWIAIAGAFA